MFYDICKPIYNNTGFHINDSDDNDSSVDYFLGQNCDCRGWEYYAPCIAPEKGAVPYDVDHETNGLTFDEWLAFDELFDSNFRVFLH